MTYTLKTVENETGKIEIWQDDCVESPREWDNLGTFLTWHRNYNSPDENRYSEPRDLLVDLVSEAEPSYTDEFLEDKATMQRLLEIAEKHYIIHPVYMYEHSGRTWSTSPFSCSWDSGQVGYIFVSKEKLREEYKVNVISKHLKLIVHNVLNDEVKAYEKWAEGHVWGFTITYSDNEEESCGGFYDDDYADTIRTYFNADKVTEIESLLEML